KYDCRERFFGIGKGSRHQYFLRVVVVNRASCRKLNWNLGIAAVNAKQCDLSFRQINRKMIGIFRNFIKRKLTNDVGMGAISHHSVSFQFHRSVFEELGPTRQHLTDERDPVIRLHGLDLYIDIHITGAEQQLAGWSAYAAHASKHWLIERVEDE